MFLMALVGPYMRDIAKYSVRHLRLNPKRVENGIAKKRRVSGGVRKEMKSMRTKTEKDELK